MRTSDWPNHRSYRLVPAVILPIFHLERSLPRCSTEALCEGSRSSWAFCTRSGALAPRLAQAVVYSWALTWAPKRRPPGRQSRRAPDHNHLPGVTMATRNTTGRGGNRPRTHPKTPTKRPLAPLRSGIMGRLTRHGVARIFGPLLRTARLDAGMTQEVLAEEADMDRTYPSCWSEECAIRHCSKS